MKDRLSAADVRRLSEVGISPEEAARQLDLLAHPPPPLRLDRPCRVDDGIRRLAESEETELLERWQHAASAARFSKFVPASGAASRMFALADWLPAELPDRGELESMAEGDEAPARELLDFLDRIEELPFAGTLATSMGLSRHDLRDIASSDAYSTVLQATLDAEGLGYREAAKGLIPFHRYRDGARTAFEEQLVEGNAYLSTGGRPGRFHFTVAIPQMDTFGEAARALGPLGETTDLSFSTQGSQTDTLALEASGEPARDRDGRLLLRPGGHGALLDNLEQFGGDLVFVQNIDNILPERLQPAAIHSKKLLGGLLARLDDEAATLIRRLRDEADEGATRDAEAFLHAELGYHAPASTGVDRRRALLSGLDRPLRVCGMVPNDGEPGGGPFWLAEGGTARAPQIVESSQLDTSDPEQVDIWQRSTYFNPVMLVASLRDSEGTPYRLSEFADHQAIIVAEKSVEGRTLRVLERPGLWNGSMALWNTVFVEVPRVTFAPVKTVLDLLRPEHLC